jgi:hypothetical protein
MCSGKVIGYLGFFCRGVFIGKGAMSEVEPGGLTPGWHGPGPGRTGLVCGAVTTQDFIKFWGKIFIFILLVLIENSQGFKTF